MDNRQLALILGLAGGILVILIVFVSISWDSVEYTEYGLDYSGFGKTVIARQIDRVTYTSGIHIIGIGHSFIKYPRTIQTVEFSNSKDADRRQIVSRTSDGLEVLLEISFQYTIIQEKLFDLHMSFGEDFRRTMINYSIDLITDISTVYSANEFFKDRAKIGTEMQKKLNDTLSKTVFVSVQYFQLRDVDLPDPFELAIEKSQVKTQDIEKAKAEVEKAKIEAGTSEILADMNTKCTVVRCIQNIAGGEAQTITNLNKAMVDAYNAVEMSLIFGLRDLKKALDFSNANLLDYKKADIIKKFRGQKIAISLNSH